MDITRQVNRVLHDEHMHVQGLLNRLGNLLGQNFDSAQALACADNQALLAALTPVLAGDLARHFRLEEEELFPRLVDAGEDDMVGLLREEHEALLPLADKVAQWVARAREGTLSTSDWAGFRHVGLAFVELQTSHIEKEELALLPALEDALDEDEDARICLDYAAG
jgi:hemerythrin-like domain-containing protein